ncbi:MAG: hypothetical protein C4342_01660 [Armatimonadota bacterium]
MDRQALLREGADAVLKLPAARVLRVAGLPGPLSLPRDRLRGLHPPRRPARLPAPRAESRRRYVEGQKLYLGERSPKAHARAGINNENPTGPYFMAGD